jgi:iron complex transport system permease protein
MKTNAKPFLITLALLLVALVMSVAVGSVFISPAALFNILFSRLTSTPLPDWIPASFATIIFSLRLPRTILMGLTGAALSGSGTAYQGLFRNPLADPFLIGVASGAGLGAVIAMSIHYPYSTMSLLVIPIAAFAGGAGTVLIVYELARVRRTIPTTNLILAGVAVSSFATAGSSFLMINGTGELRRALVWMLGGSTLSGWLPVFALLPYALLGLGALSLMGHTLNVLQFGDEQAHQLGLRVERVRLIIVIAATLATASAVAFSGIIGFVGLVVPHVLRLAWGGDYRRLLPLSFLGGAAFLLIADVLARVVLSPQELPVGIITSLVGAPFFLWVLRRAKQQNFW